MINVALLQKAKDITNNDKKYVLYNHIPVYMFYLILYLYSYTCTYSYHHAFLKSGIN